MGKLRTLSYTLSDGQVVTTREVSLKIGITESAARNRLNRHKNPEKIFEPYNPKKGGKPRGTKKKSQDYKLTKDAEMLKLVLTTI
jgi:hypothetical protein